MSNTRDTGFLRNAIQVTNQGVTFVSGSTTLMSISSSGAVTTTGVISGSNALSASFSLNSALLNGIGSVGFATTGALLEVSSSQQQISSSLLQVSASYTSLSGSYTTFSGSASTRITANSSSIQQVSSSQQQISASLLNVIANYATTGSNSFRANQSITGSLVVSSTITAQTLVVQTVTSSIVYSSGSNIFGSQLSDRQTFTGSVNITGSQTVFGNVGTNYAAQSNIRSYIYDNSANYGLVVQQDGSGAIAQFSGVSGAVRMYISASGNVGIGTATFTAGNGTNLEVANSSVARVLVTQTGTRSFSLSAESNAFYLYDQTANATRLYVSGSGLVGINTTSPSYQLDVNGTGRFVGALTGATATFSGLITSTVGNGGTLLKSTNATTSYQVGVDLRNTGGVAQFGIESSVGGTFVNGSTAYASIFGSGNATAAEIQTNGTVRLSIASTGAATFSSTIQTNGNAYILPTITGGGSGGLFLGVYPDTQYTKQAILLERYAGSDGNYGRGNLHFCNRNTADANQPTLADSRMVITSAGSVGIGAASPDTKLHISGSDGIKIQATGNSDTPSLTIINNTNQYGWARFGGGLQGNGKGYAAISCWNASTVGEVVRISGDGYVGIGTTVPDRALDVVGLSVFRQPNATNSTTLSILQTATGGNGFNDTGLVVQTNAGDGTTKIANFYDYNSGTPISRMVILRSGNVGIGTTNPEVSFVVKGASIGSGGKASFYGGGDENNWSAANNEAIRIGRADIANAYYSSIWSASGSSGNDLLHWLKFYITNGSNAQTLACSMFGDGSVAIAGALSKGSGSFRIKHPLLSKKSTHELVHSFIEGPQADLIYRGKIRLIAGRAIINIDEAATMTEGTFEALCREVQCFTSNETGWDTVRGKVEANILTIECQNTESTDEISWLVIGERKDEHMYETAWTDENGKVIVEPLIPEENNNN